MSFINGLWLPDDDPYSQWRYPAMLRDNRLQEDLTPATVPQTPDDLAALLQQYGSYTAIPGSPALQVAQANPGRFIATDTNVVDSEGMPQYLITLAGGTIDAGPGYSMPAYPGPSSSSGGAQQQSGGQQQTAASPSPLNFGSVTVTANVKPINSASDLTAAIKGSSLGYIYASAGGKELGIAQANPGLFTIAQDPQGGGTIIKFSNPLAAFGISTTMLEIGGVGLLALIIIGRRR